MTEFIFKVGQVWADRVGCRWTILSTDHKQDPRYSVQAKSENGYYATFSGGTGRFNITRHKDDEDLVNLIKDVEENVTELKFKVGDKVKHYFDDCLGTVEHLSSNQVHPYVVMWDNRERNAYKELELVLAKEEAVSNKLPSEPVPGNYYRTKDGRKVYFIGKSIKGVYLYEDPDNDWLEYTRPFQYWQQDDDDFYDIIAPWTDPLPAMEIKRWAVVCVVGEERGYAAWTFPSEHQAKEKRDSYSCPADYEIVELTGTLPAREIKQWCVITSADSKWHNRGTIIDTCNSFDRALDVVKESSILLEIVEMTGVLPQKEV